MKRKLRRTTVVLSRERVVPKNVHHTELNAGWMAMPSLITSLSASQPSVILPRRIVPFFSPFPVVSFLFIITSAGLSPTNKISNTNGSGRLKLATNTETWHGEH